MSNPLPDFPCLEQQRTRAKELLKAWRRGESQARARMAASHPRLAAGRQAEECRLSDAQLVIAREYGCASWPLLVKAISSRIGCNQNPQVVRLVQAVSNGDVAAAGRLLRKDPRLARMDLAETNEHRATSSRCAGAMPRWCSC